MTFTGPELFFFYEMFISYRKYIVLANCAALELEVGDFFSEKFKVCEKQISK